MKVGLFAPLLKPSHGGVWQFLQWIVARLGPELPLHVVTPQEVLDEIAEAGLMQDAMTTTASDHLRASAPTYGLPRKLLKQRIPLKGSLYAELESPSMIRDLDFHDVDVLHIPVQRVDHWQVAKTRPFIINPHDYQHEHFPQYFTRRSLISRRLTWYASQRAAAAVVTHSIQTRDDALKYLRIPGERVFYAPYGPLPTFPDLTAEEAAELLAPLGLPDSFVFYPARMWPHKNHARLLEALHLLKHERHLTIPCVFTDASGKEGRAVLDRVEALGLTGQVHVTGRVSPREMGALYRSATMLVVPSEFEQNSGPMLEGLHLGKAMAVSNLPELVQSLGDAGLTFDPEDVPAIARAIDDIVSSPTLRTDLESRAHARRQTLSWQPFIDTYKRAYAFAAGHGA